jgi:hypothetical protein
MGGADIAFHVGDVVIRAHTYKEGVKKSRCGGAL